MAKRERDKKVGANIYSQRSDLGTVLVLCPVLYRYNLTLLLFIGLRVCLDNQFCVQFCVQFAFKGVNEIGRHEIVKGIVHAFLQT
jgi:hypothetical protein